MTTDLEKLGIYDGINDFIEVTTNINKTANAAPIGLYKHKHHLQIHLYQNKTRENLKHREYLTANITQDPILIVTSALSTLPQETYTEIEYQQQKYPVLKNASTWILLKAKQQDKTAFTLQPLTGAAKKQTPRAINRGLFAVIEATVHATRYVIFHGKEQLRSIKYYNNIVNRCGSPAEIKAMNILCQLANIELDSSLL